MLLVWACGRQFTDVSGVGLGALDVLVPNHHAVLGHRFEETAPRVHSFLPLPFPPPPPCICSPHVSVSAHPSHVSWPYRELHRRSQWRSPHAPLPPSTAFRGPIGSSTEGPSGGARMRLPRPGRRFVALIGTPITRFLAS